MRWFHIAGKCTINNYAVTTWCYSWYVPDEGYSRNALWALNLISTVCYKIRVEKMLNNRAFGQK